MTRPRIRFFRSGRGYAAFTGDGWHAANSRLLGYVWRKGSRWLNNHDRSRYRTRREAAEALR